MIAFLRHLLFDDFWLKLFSLALAVVIWITVSLAIQKEVSPAASLALTNPGRLTFSHLPVIVLSSASDVRSFKVNPNEVEVTVEGDIKRLQNLQPKDIRVMVDLTGIESARDLTKRIDVSTPAGVTHTMVAPQEVQIIIPPKG
jgi:YbbR domain-containing protein